MSSCFFDPDGLKVAMYLDAESPWRFFSATGTGIAFKAFKGNVVPFAPRSEGEVIALMKYTRAHKTNQVRGPPKYLVSIKIPWSEAWQHMLAQEIKIVEGRPEATIGFTKDVNTINYPTLRGQVVELDEVGLPEQLLRAGYDHMGWSLRNS